MSEPCHIGKDKLLALNVDVIDVISIDNKPPANANEQVVVRAKLIENHILNLPQLEREQTRLIVGLHKVAVVAVRRDIDYLVGGDAHQVGGSGYDQIFLQHDATKV